MKHIRTVSVEKANLGQPIADFYFQALRSYEDLKLFLKFDQNGGTFPGTSLIGNLFGNGPSTSG